MENKERLEMRLEGFTILKASGLSNHYIETNIAHYQQRLREYDTREVRKNE